MHSGTGHKVQEWVGWERQRQWGKGWWAIIFVLEEKVA